MIDLPAAARDSLSGLAFGDAFGDRWFGILRREGPAALEARIPPPEPLWRWSDDTAQALALVRELAEGGGAVDQDRLALRLAEAYAEDTHRGYGASMHDVLRRIGAGEPWREVVAGQFGGQGSWGNGAAMRVAPLGAWHAADLDAVAEQAAGQSAVSHHHPEAVSGAVAVALAAALATRSRGGTAPARPDFLRAVAERLPVGDVRSGVRIAARMPDHTSVRHAAEVRHPLLLHRWRQHLKQLQTEVAPGALSPSAQSLVDLAWEELRPQSLHEVRELMGRRRLLGNLLQRYGENRRLRHAVHDAISIAEHTHPERPLLVAMARGAARSSAVGTPISTNSSGISSNHI
ncbi:ADP-ribosylglycohydrolase family protein [Streptomyces avidinii]|uniref:ADP-ribosylglycohydrolase family protein n=1 Tax=Streptomyces avidinii TaxID=1895 RepID=UPI0037BA9B66